MAPLGSLIATRSLGCGMVACWSGIPSEMALSDKKFYLILEMVAFVGVMAVIIVEAIVFCSVSSCHILSNGWRPPVRSIVYCCLKNFCSSTYQTSIVGKPWLVLQILRPFTVVARRFLRPLILLVFAAASPIFVRLFLFLRAVFLEIRG